MPTETGTSLSRSSWGSGRWFGSDTRAGCLISCRLSPSTGHICWPTGSMTSSRKGKSTDGLAFVLLGLRGNRRPGWPRGAAVRRDRGWSSDDTQAAGSWADGQYELGHRSNRVTSHKRGGDSHRGGGGTGKKPPTKGICGLIVFGSAAFILTGLGAGFAQII